MSTRRRFYPDTLIVKVAVAVAIAKDFNQSGSLDSFKDSHFRDGLQQKLPAAPKLHNSFARLIICILTKNYDMATLSEIVTNIAKYMAVSSVEKQRRKSNLAIFKSLLRFLNVENISILSNTDREMIQSVLCLLLFNLELNQLFEFCNIFAETLEETIFTISLEEDTAVLQSDYLKLGLLDYTLQLIVQKRSSSSVLKKRKHDTLTNDKISLPEEFDVRDSLLILFEKLYRNIFKSKAKRSPFRNTRLGLAQVYLCYCICGFLEI